MIERRKADRRKNPIFRCPENYKRQLAHASVGLIVRRLIEQAERRKSCMQPAESATNDVA